MIERSGYQKARNTSRKEGECPDIKQNTEDKQPLVAFEQVKEVTGEPAPVLPSKAFQYSHMKNLDRLGGKACLASNYPFLCKADYRECVDDAIDESNDTSNECCKKCCCVGVSNDNSRKTVWRLDTLYSVEDSEYGPWPDGQEKHQS